MGKWRFIAIILAIFISPLMVNASLTISPNPYETTITAGQSYGLPIKILNNFSFPIYNITFQNTEKAEYPMIESLGANEEIEKNILVQTNVQENKELTSKVEFIYLSDISGTPEILNTNIEAIRFNPNTITINKNDIIRYKNVDTISHTIILNSIQKTLQPNEIYEHTYDTEGTFEVVDNLLDFKQSVIVTSNIQKEYVHNSDYDISFKLKLNSLYELTDISSSLLTNNFTINNKENNDGLIEIKNTGQEIAKDVKISSTLDWITFSPSLTDISIGGTKYITYTINPNFNIKNQTNRDYNIPIKIKGINTEEKIESIKVFIPLDSSLSDENLFNFDNLDQAVEFIKNLIFRYEEAKRNNTNVTELYNELIYANFTQEQIYQYLIAVRGFSETQGDTNDILKTISLDISNLKEEQRRNNIKINDSIGVYEQITTKNTAFTFTILFIFFLGGLSFGLKKTYDIQKKKIKHQSKIDDDIGRRIKEYYD